MSQKKKIDDIYRDGLRNTETPPPADSWEFISSRLSEKEDEKVIPLWLKWGAVASVLALVISLYNFSSFDLDNPSPVVNQENDSEEHISPASEKSSKTGMETDLENAVTSGKEPAVELPAQKEPSPENPELQLTSAHQGRSQSRETDPASALAGSSEVSRERNTGAVQDTHLTPSPAQDLAEASDKQSGGAPEKEAAVAEKADVNEGLLQDETLVAETETETVSQKEQKFIQRLSVSTSTGAVFMDIGRGNPLDAQFAGNQGGSEVAMSYGVNISYKLSDQIKVRSGVNKMNFNYTTEQVDYSAAMGSSSVKSGPAGEGIVLSALGSLDQEFGFIEVPLEVEFNLIDKKIDLNIIGGASTLFLQKNELSMTTSAYTTDLGEAQNLNDLSFSANIGLGVSYELGPKFYLNLEPLFKYQPNTFNHSDAYTFGIYSGLSFKF